MKKSTLFLATLLCIAFVNPLISFAQPCLGPKKPTKLNDYPNGLHIVWAAGTGNESIKYREVGTTQWQTIANVKSPYFIADLKAATRYEVDITTDCPNWSRGNQPIPSFSTDDECLTATNLQVINIKVNSVTLTWDGNSGNTSYLAYRAVGETEYKIINPLPASPYTLRGLNTLTDYEYYLGTTCAVSPGVTKELKSNVQTFKTAKEANCADGGLVLRPQSFYKIVAQWFNSGQVTSIELCYKEANTTNTPTCVTLPTTANGYEILGKANTRYMVTLNITCSDGTVFTNVETASTTELPQCSISASYHDATSTSVGITLSGSYEYAEISYKKSSEAYYSVKSVGQQKEVVLSGLDPSSTYSFYVKAYCAFGSISTASSIQSFMTLASPCPMVTNFRIITVGSSYNQIGKDGLSTFCVHDGQFAWDYTTTTSSDFEVQLDASLSYDPIHSTTSFSIFDNQSYKSQYFFRLAKDVVYKIVIRVTCPGGGVTETTNYLVNPDPGSCGGGALIVSNNPNNNYSSLKQSSIKKEMLK